MTPPMRRALRWITENQLMGARNPATYHKATVRALIHRRLVRLTPEGYLVPIPGEQK